MAPTVVRVARSALLGSPVNRVLASEFVQAVRAFVVTHVSICRPTTATAVHAVLSALAVGLAKADRVRVLRAGRSATVLALMS